MKQLYISASQLETADSEDGEGCLRKWWAEKVAKLPRPPSSSSQAFGTAFHAVCERYLRADYLGRDEHGEPVALYPKGWEIVTERDGTTGTLSPMEQQQLVELFNQLVDQGLIQRWEGRQVEHGFGASWDGQQPFEVVEHRGVKVFATGYIDVLLPDTVLDWKTTKKIKYAKSPNKLRKTLQMLLYAKVLQRLRQARGAAALDSIQAVHVYACKDSAKPEVRRVPVWIPAEEVEQGWQRIQHLARRMVDVALSFPSEDSWFDVPGPSEGSRACNAYGGCPRQLVCSGRQSIEHHRNIVDRLVADNVGRSVQNQNPFSHTSTGNTMGLLANRAAAAQPQNLPTQIPAAPVQAAAPAAFPTAPVSSPPPVVVPPPQAAQPPAAPWASPGCMACGSSHHPGWNTAGDPCRICDAAQTKAQKPVSGYYTITQGDGVRYWTANPDAQAWLQSVGAPLEGSTPIQLAAPVAVSGNATAYPPTPPAQPQAVQQPAAAPDPQLAAPEEQDEEEEVQEPLPEPKATTDPKQAPAPGKGLEVDPDMVKPKAGRGRPTAAFLLYIGCAPTVGPAKNKIVQLEEVHQRMAEKLAKISGVESYYELHPFARRDAIAQHAAQIAAHLGKATVTVASKSPDMVAFIDAMRPYAGTVVEAFAPALVDGSH